MVNGSHNWRGLSTDEGFAEPFSPAVTGPEILQPEDRGIATRVLWCPGALRFLPGDSLTTWPVVARGRNNYIFSGAKN